VRDGCQHSLWTARRLFIFPVFLTLLFVNAAAATGICGYPEKGTLVVNREETVVGTFRVGVAETSEQHGQGLMGCRDLAPGAGLLFIYPDARQHTFWMKDTPLPLAIVFIASSGRIAAIEAGQPFSTDRIRSPDDIQYVLEIHQTEVGALQVGDRITMQLTPE